MTLQYELLPVASRFETVLLFSLDVSQEVKKHHRNQLLLKCRPVFRNVIPDLKVNCCEQPCSVIEPVRGSLSHTYDADEMWKI